MPVPRYAARVDNAQEAIVTALRQAGADVEISGRPVDLLVGFKGRTYLLEVKSGKRKRRDQPAQDKFLATWRGQVKVVRTPWEALKAIGAVK